jgi:hypothetical protein
LLKPSKSVLALTAVLILALMLISAGCGGSADSTDQGETPTAGSADDVATETGEESGNEAAEPGETAATRVAVESTN